MYQCGQLQSHWKKSHNYLKHTEVPNFVIIKRAVEIAFLSTVDINK